MKRRTKETASPAEEPAEVEEEEEVQGQEVVEAGGDEEEEGGEATTNAKQVRVAEFGEMGLDPRILKALERKLAFAQPTLVQQHFIPLALAGRDILARSRTGSGKFAIITLFLSFF